MSARRIRRVFEDRAKDLASLLVSSGVLVLSQHPYELGLLATVGLVPWLFRTRRTSACGAVVLGLAFGVVHSALAADWIFDALAAEGSHGVRRLVAVLLIAVWAKGLHFAAAGWLVHRLRSRRPVIAIVLPATFFGFVEYWIADSAWGLPLLLLGHSQASVLGVAQLAATIGVPGVSGLLFALNLALVSAIVGERSGRRLAFILGSAWLIAALIGEPIARLLVTTPSFKARRILVVQPNHVQSNRWEWEHQEATLSEIATETSRALAEVADRPDVILWPESLLRIPIGADRRLDDDHRHRNRNSHALRLQALIDEWNVPVVLGIVRRTPGMRRGRYINSVVWWSPTKGPIDVEDKVRAIPVVESSRSFWGESLFDWALAGSSGAPRLLEATRAESLKGEFTLSPALCFEILFPRVVSDRRDEESVAIVNLAEDSWVPGEALDRQLIAAATFRAIEQRLTLIRVSRGGLSIALDRFGREIASLPPNEIGHMTITVGPKRRGM